MTSSLARHPSWLFLAVCLPGCADNFPVGREAVLGELSASEAESVCAYVPIAAIRATATKREACTRKGMVNSASPEACRSFVDVCLGGKPAVTGGGNIQGEYLQSGDPSYGAPDQANCRGVTYEGCSITFGEYADCLSLIAYGIAAANHDASCDRVRRDQGPLTSLPESAPNVCDVVARDCPSAAPYPTEFGGS